MAQRKPLVLVNGNPEELPTGDSLAGVSGSGTPTDTYIEFSVSGTELVITQDLVNSYSILNGDIIRSDWYPTIIDGELTIYV